MVLTVALLLLAFLEFPTVFLEEDPSAFSTYQSDWLRVSQSYLQYLYGHFGWEPDDYGFVTASNELATGIYNNSEQKLVLWAMVTRGKPTRAPVDGMNTYLSYNILSTDCCSI